MGMEEGRVHTHGTLSAVRQRSERVPPRFRGCQVRNAGETYCARQRVVARYGSARPS